MSLFFPFWDNNTHMNVYSSLFEIIIPIWMFQSLFSLSLHYHRLISINCRYCFSHYCFIFIIVLVIHKNGIIWYQILFWIGISMICNITSIAVYSHFVVVAAIHFISFFSRHRLWFHFHFHFHIINQRYWCPFAKPILLLLLLLFVLLFVGNG